MTRRVEAFEAFEAVFGFAPPDAREREALGVLRAYLWRAGRELGRRAWGSAFDGRGGMAVFGREAAMATEAMLLVTMREGVLGVASFCDGLLEAVEPPAVAPSHPPEEGGARRAP